MKIQLPGHHDAGSHADPGTPHAFVEVNDPGITAAASGGGGRSAGGFGGLASVAMTDNCIPEVPLRPARLWQGTPRPPSTPRPRTEPRGSPGAAVQPPQRSRKTTSSRGPAAGRFGALSLAGSAG